MAYSARQNLVIRAQLAIASKVGAWPKATDTEGACYVDEPQNPHRGTGMKCANCAFWRAPSGCSIVKGAVQAGGLCRLRVIAQARLGEKLEAVSGAARGRMVGEIYR